MKITNKEVLQSYILTTAKYDYSVYEKRILYRIISLNQDLIEGKDLDRSYSVSPTLFDSRQYIMPLSAFLNGEDKADNNHARIKSAFKTLQQKIIEYEDKEVYRSAGILFNVSMDKKRANNVTFYVAEWIYQSLMDFSKGFRKYELETAMQFQSEYSMRFYELFSNQKKPIIYGLEKLKEMFGLTDKYKLTADFIKRVILPAKNELDKTSPYTFNFNPLKKGNKINSIQFIPIYQPQFEDRDLKKKRYGKELSLRWFITETEQNYLEQQYHFTEIELKNNIVLFEGIFNNFVAGELLDLLSEIRVDATNANKTKAFVIGVLKRQLTQRIEQKHGIAAKRKL